MPHRLWRRSDERSHPAQPQRTYLRRRGAGRSSAADQRDRDARPDWPAPREGFTFTDEETLELRAAFDSFERGGGRGLVVDVRWCGGGFSIGLNRLLVDRGRLFSRVRYNEGGFHDGRMRQDIDADGTAPPFQRPLVILNGPGSISGAESFAGPMQALGRATLVGERTAGLCGTGPWVRSRVWLADVRHDA
jgi:Peptidase family S41